MFNRGLEAIWLIKHSDYTNHNTFHITKKKAFLINHFRDVSNTIQFILRKKT